MKIVPRCDAGLREAAYGSDTSLHKFSELKSTTISRHNTILTARWGVVAARGLRGEGHQAQGVCFLHMKMWYLSKVRVNQGALGASACRGDVAGSGGSNGLAISRQKKASAN